MSEKRSSRSGQTLKRRKSVLTALWEGFLTPPDLACPKCAGTVIEYYDPFFFNPIRTLNGRRRLRCGACHFIWRPSRSSKSIWEKFINSYYS